MEHLANHVELLTGFPFRSALYTDKANAVRLVRGDNVVQGRLRWDNAACWPLGLAEEVADYQLAVGDIVLAMDRPWIEAGLKYACITPEDVPSLLVQRVARLRARPELDQRFLYYLIGSRDFTNHVLAVQTGTAVPHISGGQILEFRFRMLGLAQQRAIAGVLGALDDKIEQNRRTAGALERLARAIFRAWFVDFEPVKAKAAGVTSFPSMPQDVFDGLPCTFTDSDLGPIPEGWRAGRLDDAVELHDSKRIPLSKQQREMRPGPYRYYGAAGIVGHIDDYIFDGVYVLIGEDGTVVTEADRPMVQYVWGQFWVNNHAHVAMGANGYTTEHIRLLLDNVNIRPFVTGAVQPKLNQNNLKSVPILRAPDDVNKQFGKGIVPLFALLRQIEDESRNLAVMRDYLLPKLLSGAVRVGEVL